MRKIIVVGGGAAGMMAAVAASAQGARVVLFEKNEKLGKKLFITGKGRCNVTNACDMEGLFRHVVTNAKFLYSAFYGFDNQSVMAFFENAGCPLKIERGERVFPVSDHSSDVIRALAGQLKKGGVDIRLHTGVRELLRQEERAAGVVLGDGRSEKADAVILAAGGLSYPLTGSTGDGYRMAVEAGHSLKETCPSLVPLEVEGDWCGRMQGLSLRNVSAALAQKGKKPFYQGFGEMLFTHFGVSGPLILSASSYYAARKDRGDTVLHLDLKPALTAEQLDRRLLRDFEENKNRQFKNALGGLFPARLIPVILEMSGVDEEKKVHEITRAERTGFVRLIKDVELKIKGARDFREAVITKGGVSVKEVNPSTMESKKLSGLYFAGEILDLDALTGGFNLQIAWSTGWLAGKSAAGGA
ncbi:MAG: NAD(P)/FAD-dependent oxidoreductase [Lachnospiraceae bacterium]|nr:NAD(P)/FAD-dependent oxidoreductase [Lachnospiraceae bacterium]